MSDNITVMYHRQQELTAEIARLRREKAELMEVLTNIVDCYGVGLSPKKFCEHVHDFMMAARSALRSATETKDGQ